MVDGIFDGGDGTGDTLVVGDLFVSVEGDVEVNLDHQFLVEYPCELVLRSIIKPNSRVSAPACPSSQRL